MITFEYRMEVHPSSHNCPKDMKDALWISLNTCASGDFLNDTEDAGILPLKEEGMTSFFWEIYNLICR